MEAGEGGGEVAGSGEAAAISEATAARGFSLPKYRVHQMRYFTGISRKIHRSTPNYAQKYRRNTRITKYCVHENLE